MIFPAALSDHNLQGFGPSCIYTDNEMFRGSVWDCWSRFSELSIEKSWLDQINARRDSLLNRGTYGASHAEGKSGRVRPYCNQMSDFTSDACSNHNSGICRPLYDDIHLIRLGHMLCSCVLALGSCILHVGWGQSWLSPKISSYRIAI